MHAFMMHLWAWIVTNPLVGIALAVVVAILLWKQPRQTMKLAFAIMVLVALGYLVSGIIHFVMDSSTMKGQMIEKTQ